MQFAFAYGSGVIPQAGYESDKPSEKKKSPQLDMIFIVEDPPSWHQSNLSTNWHHYSSIKYMGHDYIAKIQDEGPGVFFNPFVDYNGLQLKYGVVSTKQLLKDLTEWDSLYLSGRLHKPVLFIEHITTPVAEKQVRAALRKNRTAALSMAMLQLQAPFSELELYLKIASISYQGDVRMSFAENPNKVANIVWGNLPGFRGLYGEEIANAPMLSISSSSGWAFPQSAPEHTWIDIRNAPDAHGSFVAHLPLPMQIRLSASLPQSKNLPVPNSTLAWRERLETTTHDEIKSFLNADVENIVRQASIGQSRKGLITAGVSKSFAYALRKIQKRFR